MRYVSTRGFSAQESFADILLTGVAPDGGLYVPEAYPGIDVESLRGAPYVDVAYAVLRPYISDIPQKDLRMLLEKTYTPDVFGSERVTPVTQFMLGQGTYSLLHLSNGPTFSFKDVALQFLGNLFEYELERRGTTLCILGATSGDTGSAAIEAVRGKKNIQIVMLSPHERMSPFQAAQMYSVLDDNVHNLAVRGTFDDCQRIVKTLMNDPRASTFRLGSVNSINWARIIAQTVYWVYGYLQASAPQERLVGVVPTGNFGNAFSLFVARQMGVPMDILIATNENDVLHQFFENGVYCPRASDQVQMTLSPSMDIAAASNFERLMYYYHGAEGVRDLWGNHLATTGKFYGQRNALGRAYPVDSCAVKRADVVQTMKCVYDSNGMFVDPHTAVGVHAAFFHAQYHAEISQHYLIAETALPCKFEATVREAIGEAPPIPKAARGLLDRARRYTPVHVDADLVRNYIAHTVLASHE